VLSAQAGEWTVEISGFDLLESPQRFSVCSSADFLPGATRIVPGFP
jgi:hypothetical protein